VLPNIKLPKKYIPYIVAGCDAITIILYLFMLFSLYYAEDEYMRHSAKEAPQIQYFTLQFSNLPTDLNAFELKT